MDLRETVIREFGPECIQGISAIRNEEVFREIMESVGLIKCCIEIGTYIGISAVLLAEYADKVHTYDITNFPMRILIWRRFESKNITFHHIKRNDKKIFPKFDFAFVDGRHGGDGPAIDFEEVKSCGRVLFHDYKHNEIQSDNVIKFVDSIKEGTITIKEPFALWLI